MSDIESFDSVMAEMRKFVVDCDMERCDMYDGDCNKCQGDILDRMQRAHERELAQARDPQRLRWAKPNTFDGAIEALREFRWQHATNDEDAVPYINEVKEMHDYELEHVRKAEYARGYRDGQRSMDAEHYAVALRLMHLPLDGGSHENLSQIARAIYHSDFGWTQGACRELRDKLVELMGGVHKPDAALPTYDVLGNERHKAVCELKKIHTDTGGFVKALANALGVEWQAPRVHQTIAEVRDRLIHLLGGDEPTAMEYIQYIVSEYDRKCLYMELSGAELSQASVEAMSSRANDAYIEHKDDCLTLRDGLGGEMKFVKGDVIFNGESLIESLVKNIEELSRQGKVKFPPNEDGSLDGLKTVEETAALINEVKRRADQSHESSPMSLENGTGIIDEPDSQKSPILANSDGEDGGKVTITDELRKWASDRHCKGISHTDALNVGLIADRIDEQFARCCELWERVAQDAIHAQLKAEEERNHVRFSPEPITYELRKWMENGAHYNEIGHGVVKKVYIPWFGRKSEIEPMLDRIDELCAKYYELCEGQAADKAKRVHDSMEAECNKLVDERDMWRGKAMQLADVVDRYVGRCEDLLDLLRDAAKEYVESNNVWSYASEVSENMRLERKCNELLELLRDAASEYQDKHHLAQVWHDRAESMQMERDRLERELSEQKSCAEGFAMPEWYEERVLNMEKERDELQAKLDAIREAVDAVQ